MDKDKFCFFISVLKVKNGNSIINKNYPTKKYYQ